MKNNKSFFIANNQNSNCLSDGTHDITLKVCDSSNNCANETRRIELTNLPPSISVVLTPLADVTNRILLSRTQVLHLNASASVDPENQPFQTSIDVSFSEWADDPGDCSTPDCPLEYNISFEDSPNAVFDLTFVIGDGLNTPLTYSWSVELYNELPTPNLQVSRESNLSSSEVTLDARGTVDPEGDQITYRFIPVSMVNYIHVRLIFIMAKMLHLKEFGKVICLLALTQSLWEWVILICHILVLNHYSRFC